MAPRGVVAAAVTAVFALRLEQEGFAGAERLVPIVFFVIVGTVAIYGLVDRPLAIRLGIAERDPNGVIIVGAHPFARGLAPGPDSSNVEFPVTSPLRSRDRVCRARFTQRIPVGSSLRIGVGGPSSQRVPPSTAR
jgi:hypothetical protein